MNETTLLPSAIPNAIDYLENAPEATVALAVLFVFYKIIMSLIQSLDKKEKS